MIKPSLHFSEEDQRILEKKRRIRIAFAEFKVILNHACENTENVVQILLNSNKVKK